MPFSNSSQMMSVYEISWSFLDVFPGHSDLTPQEWTLGMCKCAVNFLPFCTNCLFLPNVQEEETTLMPESFWSPRWFYFACGVIQLCLKLVQLFTLVCKWKKNKKQTTPPQTIFWNPGMYSNSNLNKLKNDSNCGAWGLFYF